MSAKDDLTIFLNIMAQSDSGLGDPHLIGKFSKAKAQLHALDSFNALQTQIPPPISTPPIQNAPQNQNNALGGTIPQEQIQTPQTPMEGQDSLNLP
jgi:hypothetical protein